ncbi:IclR family transcriptional regulator [Kaustia mangrovi]|uniref:IclR family transcriptional regulator n=1 Tax=Kaustia mangrovi TaxID=2593653 RepID=A0A7S8C469_9HYPH|nr:IclR family transcriptional regulator [Kaustia mangrovi]QPC42997.1 IclR family transcriptional regulator [Kaustia mangrovi]
MTVRQADNVLRFFEYFAQARKPATLTQLSETLDLPLSSTSNLVATLRHRGYLFEVRRRGGFYPTRRMYDVSRSILDGDPVLGLVRDHMGELRDRTGETVLLAARDGDNVIYLDTLESPKGVRYSARPGETRPVYAISSGKAILAALPDDVLERELKRIDFSGAARTSITDIDALMRNIRDGRARGWFLNATEYTPEVSGIGMLLEVAGQQLGLSVAGPNYRMQGRHEEIAEVLADTIRAIRAQVDDGWSAA